LGRLFFVYFLGYLNLSQLNSMKALEFPGLKMRIERKGGLMYIYTDFVHLESLYERTEKET
jgi:hypothetical protein